VRDQQFPGDQKDVRFDAAEPLIQRIEERVFVQIIIMSVRLQARRNLGGLRLDLARHE
jgi:hypothetical protein